MPALAYVAQVVLARLMGQFEYGVFAYTWVWFMVGGAVSTLGFGDRPLRFIPQLRERGEADHLRGFLRFAALVTIATSFVAAALLIAGMLAAGRWIGSAYVLPMALMALSLPFACMQSFLEGVGRSYGWTMPALLPIYILRHGLLLVFMVAAVALGFEASAIDAFICLVLTLAVSTALPGRRPCSCACGASCRPGPPPTVRANGCAARRPSPCCTARSYLSSFADVLVLSFFVSPAEIAIYFAATRIIQVVNLIPFAATVGTAHLFSATHTRGDRAELQRLCRHVAVTTFIIAAVAVGIHLVAGEWLLGMFGDGFDAGYVPLAILAARRAGAGRRRAGGGHAEHDRPRRALRLHLPRRHAAERCAQRGAGHPVRRGRGGARHIGCADGARALPDLRGAPPARHQHLRRLRHSELERDPRRPPRAPPRSRGHCKVSPERILPSRQPAIEIAGDPPLPPPR